MWLETSCELSCFFSNTHRDTKSKLKHPDRSQRSRHLLHCVWHELRHKAPSESLCAWKWTPNSCHSALSSVARLLLFEKNLWESQRSGCAARLPLRTNRTWDEAPAPVRLRWFNNLLGSQWRYSVLHTAWGLPALSGGHLISEGRSTRKNITWLAWNGYPWQPETPPTALMHSCTLSHLAPSLFVPSSLSPHEKKIFLIFFNFLPQLKLLIWHNEQRCASLPPLSRVRGPQLHGGGRADVLLRRLGPQTGSTGDGVSGAPAGGGLGPSTQDAAALLHRSEPPCNIFFKKMFLLSDTKGNRLTSTSWTGATQSFTFYHHDAAPLQQKAIYCSDAFKTTLY